jgi:hypothetical protein
MNFDPEVLKQRAVQETGLGEFGAEPFEDGLAAFCAALEGEADLNAGGRTGAEKAIVAALSERLRVEDWLRRHPEILDQQLLPQVFVVGLPRTGTTALSQFLSEDPAARSIRRWELNSLTPPPDAGVGIDPRLIATREAFAARDAAMPALKTMLPVEAEDPSEHGVLLGLTFRNLQIPTLYNAPSYIDWLWRADLTIAYGYMAKVLKLLQWKTPGGHWNLKNPPDIFAIDAIASVFPDAKFVWTHRDPAQSIASVCSLAALLRRPGVEHYDARALMGYVLDFQSEGVRRAMQARDRLPKDRFIDVFQADLGRDTVAVIQGLYANLGLPFTTDYEAHLHERMRARPRGRHGEHAYDRDEFGVSAEQIRTHFQAYLDRFDVLA